MDEEHYSDIAPFEQNIFDIKMRALVEEPGFIHAIRYIMPDIDYDGFAKQLLSVHNTTEFQHVVMRPFLERLAANTTASISSSGLDNIDRTHAHVFITNHRDIVLDASFLNLCFMRNNLATTEIALGDNLLIYDWIESLVKLNKGFIVKRNLRLTKAFEAAKHLSAYIRHCIVDKETSIWIAQREGRAKDSNDRTQESLIKMLGMSAAVGESLLDAIMKLHLTPTAIAYEYDPTDYLKVREYLHKRRDPEFRKSPHDDLLSMETGILGFKGRVHFAVSECINQRLVRDSAGITDKNELVRLVCHIIDECIHGSYYIYPINYVAYDMLNRCDRFADRYTAAERSEAEAYFDRQIAKVEVPDVTDEECGYMMSMLLTMYANPLINQLAARGE